MSIRTINFIVEADKITPSTLQRGGQQGEHNATELVFNIDPSLINKLSQVANGATIYYRIEGHTGIGMKNSTLPVVLNIPDDYSAGFALNYLLENWLTREGGNITVYLIFSIISKSETLVDIYSYPARLKLDVVPDGKYTDGKNYESISKLSVAAETAAERAENAAEISETAKEQTVGARFALENGAVFIFQGGDASGAAEIDLVVDSELSEHSRNPINNKTVTEEFKKYLTAEDADKRYVSATEYTKDKKQYALDKEYANAERSEMKKKLDNITDYIVECGTSGIWYYEKRNSGRVVCYGSSPHSFVSMSAMGALYCEIIDIGLPVGVFNKTPLHAWGNVDVVGSVNVVLWESTNTKLTVKLNTALQYNASNDCTISLYVVGTWK